MEEVRRFVKNIYIVLITKRKSDLVVYHLSYTDNWKKINNSDYAEADLIALNAEEDDDILYTGQWLTGRKWRWR